MKSKAESERRERQDWLIVLLILLIGFFCVCAAAQWALRFSPSWKLNADMNSGINPNSDFLTSKPMGFFEPVDSNILTQPAWVRVFLTPGAIFATGTPPPPAGSVKSTPTAAGATSVSVTNTLPVATLTNTVIPTNTFIWIPATSTSKPGPGNTPTNTSNPPTPSADLQITKDDSTGTYTAGGALTYTIIVSNAGPSNVNGAVVRDNIPAAIIANWTWTCAAQNGGASGCDGAASNSANFIDTVNLPNGASIRYTVAVNILPAAAGNLVNIATVTIPGGYTEINAVNNAATDTDTLFIPPVNADLRITKTGSAGWYALGTPFSYTITVSNTVPGSSGVTGVTVTDTFPPQIATATGSCVGSGTVCGWSGSGNINDTVNLPFGSSITYTINVTFNAGVSGPITNQASVGGGSYTETNPVDNVSSITTSPGVDLQIAKSHLGGNYTPGNPVQYIIDVTNNSTFTVNGVAVADIFSTQFTSVSWNCAPQFGTPICNPAGGTGDINNTLDMPAGSIARYTVTANTSPSTWGTIVNTASVTTPAGFTELNAANNSSTDSDPSTIVSPINIGPGDGSFDNPPSGSSITMLISPAIAHSFVYYERTAPPPPPFPHIELDMVQIEISADGLTWYTVFYWGDGNSGNNGSIGTSYCSPAEDDNCVIPSATLVNGTGITIDIDSLGYTGSYPWVRITCPAGDSGDGCDIDSIQP